MRPYLHLLIVAGFVGAIGIPLALGGGGALVAAANFPLDGLFVLAAMCVVGASAKAIKMQCVARHLGVRIPLLQMTAISMAADSAFLATPMGSGGYPTSFMLLRRARVGVGDAAIIIATDQAFDMLFFALTVPLAISTIAPGKSGAVALLAIALVVGLAGLAARRNLLHWLRLPKLRRLAKIAVRTLLAVRDKWRMLRAVSLLSIVQIAMLTIVQQTARYGLLWFVFARLGVDMLPGEAFAAQFIVAGAAGWTGVPAGLGGAEIGLAATFAAKVSDATIATALLLWRLGTLYLPLLLGGLSLLWLFRMARQTASPVPESTTAGSR